MLCNTPDLLLCIRFSALCRCIDGALSQHCHFKRTPLWKNTLWAKTPLGKTPLWANPPMGKSTSAELDSVLRRHCDTSSVALVTTSSTTCTLSALQYTFENVPLGNSPGKPTPMANLWGWQRRMRSLCINLDKSLPCLNFASV